MVMGVLGGERGGRGEGGGGDGGRALCCSINLKALCILVGVAIHSQAHPRERTKRTVVRRFPVFCGFLLVFPLCALWECL